MSENNSPLSSGINAAPAQKRDLKQQLIDFGFEIEQPYRGCPIFSNPNPQDLPELIPADVRDRTDHNNQYHGHEDGSGPWEFVLGHSTKLHELRATFDHVVRDDKWAWSANYHEGNHGLVGCGPHIHMSLVGDYDLGDNYGHQKSLPYADWSILWNTWVSILPFVSPFFKFGKNFRISGLESWAHPVYDRFSEQDIRTLFTTGGVTGIYTGQRYGTYHDYYALSWNHKAKPNITLELRLNENHPYFTMPACQLLAAVARESIERGFSVKLIKPEILKDAWQNIAANGVYDGLLKTKGVEFLSGRNIPCLVRDGQEKSFPTGLDLFRSLCRRFSGNGKKETPVRFGKVMRMYSDFLAVEKVPTHLIWDIDELYHQLYEVDNAKENQDAWLHFGSKIILPEKVRLSTKNTVERLLSA